LPNPAPFLLACRMLLTIIQFEADTGTSSEFMPASRPSTATVGVSTVTDPSLLPAMLLPCNEAVQSYTHGTAKTAA